MKLIVATGHPEASKPSSFFAELRFHGLVFLGVAVATYSALAAGLGWLVGIAFLSGLLYAGWLLARPPRRRSLADREDLPANMPLPEGSEEQPEEFSLSIDPAIRKRILDELVWGQTDPVTMEIATAIAGPGGNVVARYLELRAAHFSSPTPVENSSPPECRVTQNLICS
jgi:hypothetical protein